MTLAAPEILPRALCDHRTSPLRERQAGLDRGPGAVAPDDPAVAGVQRVYGAVLAAEVDAPAGDQRRRLRGGYEALGPDHLRGLRVKAPDAAAGCGRDAAGAR